MDQAVLEIKRNPELELERVAGCVGISADRLGQLFRREMGEGFVTFRNHTRLSRMDELMEVSPDANLLNAALESGFGSYPQFYRIFVKARGVSPYNYYKKIPTEPEVWSERTL